LQADKILPARQQAGHPLMLFSERANYAFFPEGRFPSCFRREKKPADQLSLFLLCSFLPGFSAFSPQKSLIKFPPANGQQFL